MMENLVSVKVGRVVSRIKDVSHFISPEEYQSFLGRSDNLFETIVLPDHLQEEWQILPQNFANVYLGETFSFCLNCTNDSVEEVVSDALVRVDLQVGNRVVNVGEARQANLDVKQSFAEVMKHEVKELGPHVLICTISYLSSNERFSSRKFFKFQVFKPLDVKTKFYNAESDEVYLEALLQNLTQTPICLEKVMLEPTDYFDVKSMNTIQKEDGTEESVFGKINRFNSQECRQYLFCLTPKSEYKYNSKVLKNVTAIGKLDIVWLSGIGENGHLQTSQLERMAPSYGDIKLTIEQIPSKVKCKEKFNTSFRIINCCERTIEPSIVFDNLENNQAIVWLGISGKCLGKLEPSATIDFQIIGYPLKLGLHSLPCLKIKDSKSLYDFDEVAFVYVE